MGLFYKSPAEKKLVELTGGFLLNDSFKERLTKNGLSIADGEEIRNQLRNDIQTGILNVDGVEIRLNYLIKQKIANETQKELETIFCPNCKNEIVKGSLECQYCKTRFDSHGIIKGGFTNLKKCPKCGIKINEDDTHCLGCGYSFLLMTCPNCDNEIESTADSCKYCKSIFDSDGSLISATVVKKCPGCDIKVNVDFLTCPNCNFEFESDDEYKVNITPEEEEIKKLKFLINQPHNTQTCPQCQSRILKGSVYCHSCGFNLNDSSKELLELEQLYNMNVQKKYTTNFKFAYVLYLDEFRKNQSARFGEMFKGKYNTSLDSLAKQAMDDNFIQISSNIKNYTVVDLKNILRKNNLSVSGRKEELIARINENISYEKLDEIYEISPGGVEFIKDNDYVLLYNSNDTLLNCITPQELESKIQTSDNPFVELLCEKLETFNCKNHRLMLTQLAGLVDDSEMLLDIYIKLFLYDVNNYNESLKRAEPFNPCLNPEVVEKLNEILHHLSLPMDELKRHFMDSYESVKFPVATSPEDSFIFIIKAFNDMDLDKLSGEISDKYSNI